MQEAVDAHDPMGPLAEAFIQCYRQGETPSIRQWADDYPQHAERIYKLFPTLVLIEELSATRTGNCQTVSSVRAVQGPSSEAIPQRIGDYHIQQEIGRGGMGIVYRAIQVSLAREVALKVLTGAGSIDDRGLERFRFEAQAAGQLHHQNIVPVFEVGHVNSTHFYAMQLIEGQSLDQILELLRNTNASARSLFASPVPTSVVGVVGSEASKTKKFQSPDYFQQVAKIGYDIANAISFAHQRGILHRDIKPSNIMLDDSGHVWITDFGLAKAFDFDNGNEAALTSPGEIIGTIRYMAPERFRGWSDPRSDIYGIGITLYELLTLRHAFEGNDQLGLMHQIRHVNPLRPYLSDRSIPKDLETIVLKAIEKEPGARYATAAELAEDLLRFRENRPIFARRISAFSSAKRWCARNKAYTALALSIGFLLVLLGVGGTAAALLFRNQANQLTVQTRKLQAEQALATHHLYESLYAQGRANRWSRQIGRRARGLDALSKAAELAQQLKLGEEIFYQLRSEAISCMCLADLNEALPRQFAPVGTNVLAFDSKLQNYVGSDARGNLSIWRTEDQAEMIRLPGSGCRGQYAKFSRDGQYLAVKYDPAVVKLWDIKQVKVITEFPSTHGFDFSPDGKQFAAGQAERFINIVDIATSRVLQQIPCERVPFCIQYSADGQKLATSSTTKTVRVIDLATAQIISRFNCPQNVYAVNWDPSGKLLACACADYQVHVQNVATRSAHLTLAGHKAEVVDVAFSPTGDLLASTSWDGTTRLWDARTGEHYVSSKGQFCRFGSSDRQLAFRLSATEREMGIWDVSVGQGCRTFVEKPQPFKGPSRVSLFPNGRWMLTTGGDGARLWDVGSAQEIETIKSGNRTYDAEFHPSFQSIFTSEDTGLFEWPIERDKQPAIADWTLGPSKKLVRIEHASRFSLNPSGTKCAIIVKNHVHVIDLMSNQEISRFGPHVGLANLAFSIDGKWIATGTWQGRGVKLWEVESGKEMQDLFPGAESAKVAFSPDGKWLVAGAEGAYRFWHVGSWKPAHDVEGAFPYLIGFAPKGDLLAVSHTRESTSLIVPDTGRRIALLDSPNAQPMSSLSFSGDGGQLAVACSTHVIEVWNLREIRQQLVELGLDWDLPAYPRQLDSAPPKRITPKEVAVDSASNVR